MATYLKQIQQTLGDIIRKEDIDILTQSLLFKLQEDALLKIEFLSVAPLNKEKIKVLINQFWRTVLTGTPFRNGTGNPGLVYSLPPDNYQTWLYLFYKVIEENFSGITSDLAKTKAATNIQNFSEAMQLFRQEENHFAFV